MIKVFLSAVFLFITAFIYGQPSSAQNAETQVYQNTLRQQITTLKLNVSSLPTKKVTDLKTEYDGWHGKIISVTIDFQNNIVLIEHNALWQQQEIFEMLAKYDLPKDKIISDK